LYRGIFVVGNVYIKGVMVYNRVIYKIVKPALINQGGEARGQEPQGIKVAFPPFDK